MKDKKYLRFYEGCIKTGKMMPVTGLCDAFYPLWEDPEFELITPTNSDLEELRRGGLSCEWWGSGLKGDDPNKRYTFTPLRQNLVLLMAAIAGELG